MSVGVDSALARKAVEKGFTLTKLRKASRAELESYFAPDEVETFSSLRRTPIPPATVERLVDGSDWKCCMCWDWDLSQPVIIHHVDPHAKSGDDAYDNLVLLCPSHHAQAHYISEIARPPLPPELLRKRKSEWTRAVEEYRDGRRPKPGRERPQPSAFAAAPAPPAEFVGRGPALAALADHVGAGRTVLVAGMGGVGKSALLRKAVADLGVSVDALWANLGATAGQPSTALAAWARASGVDSVDRSIEEIAVAIRSRLTERTRSGRTVLVVVDDVREEWSESARLLASVVPAGGVAVFASRDAGLSAALGAHPVAVDVLPHAEAVRALRSFSGSAPASDATSSAIAEAVGRLPLALELAGRQLARTQGKPGASAERLLAAIEAGADRALAFPGHPGLHAVFELSYAALSPRQQSAFRAVGAFATTAFDMNAVAAMTAIAPGPLAEDLDRLVDLSLLRWGEAEGFYSVHALLHQYSSALLDGEENRDLRRAHARYFRGFVASRTKGTTTGWEEIERRLPDIIAAADHLETESPSDLVLLANSLWLSGALRRTEHFELAEELLRKAVAAAGHESDCDYEVALSGHLGALLAMTGRPLEAIPVLERAASLSEILNDKGDEAAHRGNLGLALAQVGRECEANRSHQRALQLAVESGRADVALDQLNHLASSARQRSRGDSSAFAGRLREQAASYYQAIIEAVEQMSAPDPDMKRRRGAALSNLGLLYQDVGLLDKSLEYVQAGLDVARAEGDLRGEANRTGHLGTAHAMKGDYDAAIALVETAARLSAEAGAPMLECNWTFNLGYFKCERALPEDADALQEALALIERAHDLASQIDHVELRGKADVGASLVLEKAGRHDEAYQRAARALEEFESVGSPLEASARARLASLCHRAAQ